MQLSGVVQDQVSDPHEGATGRRLALPIPLSDMKNAFGEHESSPLGLALSLRSR